MYEAAGSTVAPRFWTTFSKSHSVTVRSPDDLRAGLEGPALSNSEWRNHNLLAALVLPQE
jgi:hypothetical protein